MAMPDATAKQVSDGVEEALRDIGTSPGSDVARFAPAKYRDGDTLGQAYQDYKKSAAEFKRKLEEAIRRLDETTRQLG